LIDLFIVVWRRHTWLTLITLSHDVARNATAILSITLVICVKPAELIQLVFRVAHFLFYLVL